MLQAVTPMAPRRGGPLEIVVLGVTPEVVTLAWPQGSRLQAFDHSEAMIASVWRPHSRIASWVHQARWQALPLRAGGTDVVVGDGALNVLPDLRDYGAVLGEVARVLKPDGLLCLRCFVRPDSEETLERVAGDALAGRIASFHALKWRLAMCLSVAPDYSVAVAEIHAEFDRRFPDRQRLAECGGWPLSVIDTIDAYRDLATRYTFPTLRALDAACSAFFVIDDIGCGEYELAGRCPTITFRNPWPGSSPS